MAIELTFRRVHVSGDVSEASQEFADEREALRTLCTWNTSQDWQYVPLKFERVYNVR